MPQEDGETGEDRAAAGTGHIQLELATEMTAEQVEPGGGQIPASFHGTPHLFGDVQQQLQLRCRSVEVLLSRWSSLEEE